MARSKHYPSSSNRPALAGRLPLTPEATLAMIALTCVLGLAVVLFTVAAGVSAILDPKGAALTGGAKIVDLAGAAGGRALVFGPPPPPPTPPPVPLPPLGSVQANVPYCNGETGDLYQPRIRRHALAPVVIYVHGGGLVAGNKVADGPQLSMLDSMRDLGYLVISIDYHLLPQRVAVAPLQDTLCAVRSIKANAVTLGIDPARIAMYGFSAGGSLVTDTAVLPGDNPQNVGAYPGVSSRIQVAVTLGTAYDLRYELRNGFEIKNLDFIYGPYVSAGLNPVDNVTPDDPPMLLIGGRNDTVVSPAQVDIMDQKLTAEGVGHQVLKVTNAAHGLEASGSLVPSLAQVDQQIASFIDSHLYPKP